MRLESVCKGIYEALFTHLTYAVNAKVSGEVQALSPCSCLALKRKNDGGGIIPALSSYDRYY